MKRPDPKSYLRGIYDRAVTKRERTPTPAWEIEPRDAFLRLLEEESAQSLLELGAATGRDGAFFREHGIAVMCTDLSPEMVQRCQQQGLEARVMEVGDLRFEPETFDAAYAKNCLIHVPNAELETTLAGIARVLKPRGLFYLSVYGGSAFEGIWDGDSWEEKRFFSFRSDEELRAAVTRSFDVYSFEAIPHGFGGYHYQSLVLRKPGGS